jgi:hypothetical protein
LIGFKDYGQGIQKKSIQVIHTFRAQTSKLNGTQSKQTKHYSRFYSKTIKTHIESRPQIADNRRQKITPELQAYIQEIDVNKVAKA